MKNVTDVPVTLNLPCELNFTLLLGSPLADLCQVSMIQLIHLTVFALSRRFVVMEASMVRSPINGGGNCIMP
jgi:hypothetical protein